MATQVFPSLVHLLDARTAEDPYRTLYTFVSDTGYDHPWSRLYLHERARAIAGGLRSETRAGDRALLLYPPGPEFIAAFMGCLYAGVIAVPAYPPDPSPLSPSLNRLKIIARDSSASICLTTAGIATALPKMGSIVVIATDDLAAQENVDDLCLPDVNGETVAFLQYTSGSTGSPKGVVVTHGNLLANEEQIQQAFGATPQDIGVGWLPLYHDMGLIGLVLQPLYAGVSCYLMSPLTFLKRPSRWLEVIAETHATISGAPNFAYDLVLRKVPEELRSGFDLSAWRIAFNGAEPVRADTMSLFSQAFAPSGFDPRAFFPCYGLAESTLLVSAGGNFVGPVVKTFDRDALLQRRVKPSEGGVLLVSSGSAVPRHEVRIVHPETRRVCESDEIGEIWVSGPSVAAGYWGQPELSSKTFDARLDESDESRAFLRTGDLGFLDGSDLYVAGRIKDLIIIRGRNHYPQDIEASVERSHHRIRPGCTAAFGLDRNGAEALAVVAEIGRAHTGMDLDEVVDAVRSAVSRDHALEVNELALVPFATLPKTSSGKIRRSAAKESFLRGEWPPAFTSRSPQEEETSTTLPREAPTKEQVASWLIDRLSATLGSPERVDRRRPFADYGVGSASMVAIVGDLERFVGRPLPATLLYEYSTIDRLATHLSGDSGDVPPLTTRARMRKAGRHQPGDQGDSG